MTLPPETFLFVREIEMMRRNWPMLPGKAVVGNQGLKLKSRRGVDEPLSVAESYC